MWLLPDIPVFKLFKYCACHYSLRSQICTIYLCISIIMHTYVLSDRDFVVCLFLIVLPYRLFACDWYFHRQTDF